MKKNIKQFVLWIFCGLFLFVSVWMCPENSYGAGNNYSVEEIYDAAMGIVDWAAPEMSGELFQSDFCAGAGSSGNDWFAIGFCQLQTGADASGYLQGLKAHVEQMYAAGNLANQKATEWHRISLAVLAAGGNPTRFGTAPDGSTIDLIADGTYDHAKYSSLGRQGINGWCFALLAMDGAGVRVPDGAAYSREDIVMQLMSSQLANGGFALTGGMADVDITAMVVQALAPYYHETAAFTFENNGVTVTRTPKETVDLALSWLSAVQLDDGDYSSYGNANAESTAQVLLALTSLGIEWQKDARFVKNDHTVLDGLMRYQMEDGGFAHVLGADSAKNKSNGLASAQSLCALAAVYRQMKGMSGFYSFGFGNPALQQPVRETTAVQVPATSGQEDAVPTAAQGQHDISESHGQTHSEPQNAGEETADAATSSSGQFHEEETQRMSEESGVQSTAATTMDKDETEEAFQNTVQETRYTASETEQGAAEPAPEQAENTLEEADTHKEETEYKKGSEDEKMSGESASDEQETLSATPEEEQKMPGYMIYVIASFVAFLGIVSYLIMRRFGNEENRKNTE